MSKLVFEKFGGEAPVIPPRHLPGAMASVARNCKLRGGKLKPFDGHSPITTPTKAGPLVSLYRWGKSNAPQTTGFITNTTQTNPVQVVSVDHGLTNGQRIYIYSIGGMVALNRRVFTLTVLDANTFSLDNEDGTPHSAYTNGGRWRKQVSRWFSWPSDVSVARGPVPGDTQERTYYTGDGVPKMTYNPIAVTGGTDYPVVSYDLGLPAPVVAPVATVVNNNGNVSNVQTTNPVQVTMATAHGLDSGDSLTLSNINGTIELNDRNFVVTVIDDLTVTLDNEDGSTHTVYIDGGQWTAVPSTDPNDYVSRAYGVTYVSAIDEEGPVSADSTIVEVGPNQHVTLVLPGAVGGNINVDRQRLYRTASGVNSTGYLFLDELPIATVTYTDSKFDHQLGEALITADWEAPPADLHGLTFLANGIAVGFSKNELCFSEPGAPHAWPVRYRRATNDPIVAIETIGQTVIVTTTSMPYYAHTTHPDSTSMTEIEGVNQACVSRRSMVRMEAFVLYASADGLVSAAPGQLPQVITQAYMDRDDWQRLNPKSIHAYYYEGTYLAFYDNGAEQRGFIFDPHDAENAFSFLDFYAEAAFNDREEDELYLLINGEVVRFDDDVTQPLSYTWRSRRAITARPEPMRAAQVYAKSYPVNFDLYANDEATGLMVLKHQQVVTSRKPFRLPSNYVADEWAVQLSGTAQDIDSVYVAGSLSALAEV